MVAGYLTGISREPAVTAVVPASLTLISGIGLFLLSKNSFGRNSYYSIFAVLNFSIALLFGSLLGAGERVVSSNHLNSMEYQRKLIEREFLLETYKKGLGLEKTKLTDKAKKK